MKNQPVSMSLRSVIQNVVIVAICHVICTSGNGVDSRNNEVDVEEASLLFKLRSEDDETPKNVIDEEKTLIWGPGLSPDEIVLPARYFFVQFVDTTGAKLNRSTSLEDELHVRIDCNGERQIWSQVLNRKDGSFIIRYKVFQSCTSGFRILVTYGNNVHLGKSPYIIEGPVHPDNCNCPKLDVEQWQEKVGCKFEKLPQQIQDDLKPFPPKSVDFEDVLKGVKEKFGSHPGSYSFCHYAIIDNQVYRKCYGQHIGFHIFPDSILLSLTRKMYLPDMEFIMNMGDWPLSKSKKGEFLLPILSWCKSNETADIVLPTYEITEASLEGMGRVSLDMMTVQANTEKKWADKIPKLFWRGRDSRQERLDLIELGRKHPDLFNVSLTNFFFFRDKEHIYGPKADHVSFFKFFDYKYQLSIDGTVAAYRLPYLLGGDSVVLKTDSQYSEHFYSGLQPWTHYIPVAADLGDLVNKIKWAQNNDAKAYEIGQRGRNYAQNHLMPVNIFCYHATVYSEFAKRLKNPVIIRPDMELVQQPTIQDPRQIPTCGCKPEPGEPNSGEEKDEL